MGMLAVIELAGKVEAKRMSLAEALRQHFATNFVSPIREEWVPVCVDIIEQYKDGNHDLSYKVHVPGEPDRALVSAESIVGNFHLDPFVGEWDVVEEKR